jgi:hypothetical protein
MYMNVGNAIEAADPGVLIICEGPMDDFNRGSLLDGRYDLSHVGAKPVVLKVKHKVVYSVHEYPNEVADRLPDSGPDYVKVMNAQWGYLETNNIAPVWIGEMGAPLTDSDTDGKAWIATLLPYINGQDASLGGPVFNSGEQPISTDWWFWGTYNTNSWWSDGTLLQWNPSAFNSVQQPVTNQLLWR